MTEIFIEQEWREITTDLKNKLQQWEAQ